MEIVNPKSRTVSWESVFQKKQETYDVYDYDSLPYYKKGDSIAPYIVNVLKEFKKLGEVLVEGKGYADLMKKSPQERCRWLIQHNKSILIRDKDWGKIFMEIEEDENAFVRYYPLLYIDIFSDWMLQIVKAFIVNDDLYEYSRELAETCEK